MAVACMPKSGVMASTLPYVNLEIAARCTHHGVLSRGCWKILSTRRSFNLHASRCCNQQQIREGRNTTPRAQHQSHYVCRRQVLGAAAALTICTRSSPSAAAQQDVCDRVAIQANSLSKAGKQPLTQRLFGKEQVYYPKWLFGEWEATAMPKGDGLLNASTEAFSRTLAIHSLQRAIHTASERQETRYNLRFYSTLPDTLVNQINMNIGRLPEDTVVADRNFNLTSTANAAAGYDLVTQSEYDPYASPDVQLLTIQPRNSNCQDVKLNLTRLQGSSLEDSPDTFCSAESYTQECNGVLTSYEMLTKFSRASASIVDVRLREVYFNLSGSSNLMSGGGGSVAAVFEYDITLRRLPPPEDAIGAAACVKTPKDFVQCM